MTPDDDRGGVDVHDPVPVTNALERFVTNLDDFTDDDEYVDVDEEMAAEYGQPPVPAWVSSRGWPGELALAHRRPERLTDQGLDAWWHDLKSWATWAIHTFRLSRTFPPCWPQHPALVEELMALWMVWQSGWLPAKEAGAPAQFLQLLDLSISRCGRLWQVSCDPAGPHKKSPDPVVGAEGEPDLRRWWGNDNYTQGATP